MKTLTEVQVTFNVAFGPERNDGEFPPELQGTYKLHEAILRKLEVLDARRTTDPQHPGEVFFAFELYGPEGIDNLADGTAVLPVGLYAGSEIPRDILNSVRETILQVLADASIPNAAQPSIHSVSETRVYTSKETKDLDLGVAG